MASIENNLLINNPAPNEIKNGNLANYQVTKADEIIKNQLADECKSCLEKLNNGTPLYIYNCRHILHETCHFRIINSGYKNCFICDGDIKLFTSYKDASELEKHEGITYADESYNQELEEIKLQNRVINSELLQYNSTYEKLLEQLEPAFIVLHQEQYGLQKQEQLLQLTYNTNENTNYKITPEITDFLEKNNIFLEIPLNMAIINNNYPSERYLNEITVNQNTARQPDNNSVANSQTATSEESNNIGFLSRIKQRLHRKSRK